MHPLFYTAKTSDDGGVDVRTTWLGDWAWLIGLGLFMLVYLPIFIRIIRDMRAERGYAAPDDSSRLGLRHWKFVLGFPLFGATIVGMGLHFAGYRRTLDDKGLHVREWRATHDFSWSQLIGHRGNINSEHFTLFFANDAAKSDIELDQRVTKPELQDLAIQLTERQTSGRTTFSVPQLPR